MTPERATHAPMSLRRGLPALLLGALVSISCGAQSAAPQPATTSSNPPWTMTWNDEFNGADGSAPDASKWTAQVGGNGWGNQELESYTTRTANVAQQGGTLVITAALEPYTGADGVTREYTSARLQSKGRFTQQYGRFEARMKLPKGQGMWPAFWLLGDSVDTAGWPACGEIDIMEASGAKRATIGGSLHGPGYSGENPLTATYTLPSGTFDAGFHVFAVEWEPQQIRFYVDDVLYETRSPSDLPAGTKWVYDHPFFVLLNLAVGGKLPGSPDSTTQFPQKMLVDYVRVYQRK